MTYTLEELTTPLTPDEVEDAIYQALGLRGAKTTAWKPGSVVRTIIAGTSIVLSALSELQAEITKGGFLELASGSWLTLVGKYVFGVERLRGTFATGQVTLTNTRSGSYWGGPGDLIVQNPSSGKEYRSTGSWSLAAGPSTTTVDVRAVELGSESTSAAGEITKLVTTLSGVTVTNEDALVGTNPEDDDALKRRCLDRTGALSPNGPRDAYSYVARNTTRENGDAIGVTRVATRADGAGRVNVWVATPSGGVDSSDLERIDQAIKEQAEPLAVNAVVESASNLSVPVTYELWIYSSAGLTSGQVSDLVSDALTRLFQTTPIGGHLVGGARRLYVSDLASAIDSVRPEIFRVAIIEPSADIPVLINQAPVAGTITGTVHQVAGGGL